MADRITVLEHALRYVRASLIDHGLPSEWPTISAIDAALAASQSAQLQHAEPSDEQVASACLSYRHDFGLISEKDRAALMFEAREWLRAWQKEIRAISKRMEPGQ